MANYKTPFEILELCTINERIALDLSTAPEVIVVKQQLYAAADAINIDSPELHAAVDALISAGVVTAERGAQIKQGQALNG